MFFYDGFVYGKNQDKSVKVSDIKVLPDRVLLITFNNNEQRVFDATVLDGKAFEPLHDESVFRNVYVDHGVVTWMDGEIDCAPEYMYEHSYEYMTEGVM